MFQYSARSYKEANMFSLMNGNGNYSLKERVAYFLGCKRGQKGLVSFKGLHPRERRKVLRFILHNKHSIWLKIK